MSTIIPDKINILAIEVLKANMQAFENEKSQTLKASGFDMELAQNTAFNFEKKNIRIRLFINIKGLNDKNESMDLLGEFGFVFHFHVENMDEFITEQENRKLIDRKLGGTLLGIAFSTARGLIIEKTALSPLGTVILPVIDPNVLVDKTTKENI